MRVLVVVWALLLPFASSEAQRNCTKGIPCGNTCIAATKTCRVGTPAPRPPAAATVTPQGDTAARVESAPWVASSRGSTYYVTGCSGARKLARQNLIYFKAEGEAQKAGYSRSVQKGC